jgi:HK97 family phage major capsid protein
MWAMATLFGDTEAARWCKDYGVRVMTGNAPGQTVVVPDEMVLPIIDLREQFGIARRYAYVHPMSSDTATIPRRKSGVTANFVARGDASSESDASFDDIQLVAREVTALTRISRAYAADAAINLADHLASEMAYAFAVKEDDCLFNGDGTSTYGGIQGIRHKILSKAGAIAAASGHDTFAEIDHDDLMNVIGVLPEYPGINPKWFASKRANALVFQALKVAAGGNSIRDIEGRVMNEYLGDEVVISQSMPQVTTALNAVAMLIYGDLNMGVTFGDRAGFEIEVLRERYAEYRQIGIQAVERFDINVHGVGDASNPGPIAALIGTT